MHASPVLQQYYIARFPPQEIALEWHEILEQWTILRRVRLQPIGQAHQQIKQVKRYH